MRAGFYILIFSLVFLASAIKPIHCSPSLEERASVQCHSFHISVSSGTDVHDRDPQSGQVCHSGFCVHVVNISNAPTVLFFEPAQQYVGLNESLYVSPPAENLKRPPIS
ncbi:MAG: hypothetical protein AB7O96_13995 [Pseudobdellovibrionaceae bacterium]